MDSDELRSVRNYFVLGLYDKCIEEAKAVSKSSPDVADWAEIYAVRAMVESHPAKVTFPKKSSTALLALQELATYRTAAEDLKEVVLDKIKGWLTSDITQSDVVLQLVAAQIYMEQDDCKSALKLVINAGSNLEKLAMQVCIFLKMYRVDMADKTVKNMQVVDDDDPLTGLASSWVACAQGGEKATEATFALQELMEKFGASVKVLNLLAACQMRLQNWSEASKHLKEAREVCSGAGKQFSAETYVNSIVNLQQTNKSNEIIQKIRGDLEKVYPNHPLVIKRREAANLFDKHAASYS
eukprot:gb/GEZN01014683.1/.p1 GENE.gb/GEZN01014683.1/~~gb/GEZN01014683.1/.p1  ORF type:complete len:297 (-),score=76.73 gb/GEZN01014683.1/:29-919(-)